MGKYLDDLKAKQAQDNLNALLNAETDNDKIESLKEVLNLLSATDDGTTKLADVINARVTAGITAALGENGAITTAISSAISAAITAAIGEGGAIETWADGRYEAKTE